MGLSADLLALGDALAPEEAQYGDREIPTASLDPRLRTTYSPRVSWGEWRGFAPAPSEEGAPEWARLWDPAPPDELGSSLAPNPKRPPRYGLQGMPAAGRRNVWRALALLEELRPLLAFWTITLPDEALEHLQRTDGLPAFQDRIRKELARQLENRGLPPMVVGVVELQPDRTRHQARPAPHLHIVYRAKRHRWQGWALSPEELDEIIRAALHTVGCFGARLGSAGRVEPIYKSVRAYMSKYMTKGGNDTARWVGTRFEALLPRQWWFWTDPLRYWVLQHVLPLAFDFLLWVHWRRDQLQALELLKWRVLPLSDPRAPLTIEVNWLGCGKLAQLSAMWQEDRDDCRLLAEWEASRQVREWFSPDPAAAEETGHLSTVCGKPFL